MGNVVFSNPEIVTGGGGNQGNQLCVATLTMSTSYATGGDSINLNELPFDTAISDIYFTDNSSGILLVFDRTSQKILAYSGSGGGTFAGAALGTHSHNIQLTADEVIAVTAGTGVSAALTNIPVGAVSSVYLTAGGVTGPGIIVPTGAVANTKEVSINYTTGVLQFLVADAVTSATVTYSRADVTAVSAGTPAGTITGGAVTIAQVANATNLSTVTTKVQIYAR